MRRVTRSEHIGTHPTSMKHLRCPSVPDVLSRRQRFSAGRGRACGLAAVVAVLLAGAPGCAGEPARAPGWVVVGLDAPPNSLDPRTGSDASAVAILDLVHRGLVRTGPAGEPVPDLAVGWDTPDPVTYRFRIGDARFQDGRPVTAADVAATYASIEQPAFQAARRDGLELIAEVVAETSHVVRFSLREPSATFLGAARLAILPAACAAEADCRIGAGPFRLGRVELDTVEIHATSTADPAPDVPGIRFTISPDSVARALGLARGTIDLVQNAVEPDLLPWLESAGLEVVSTPGSTFHYLGINVRRPELSDPRVRRAIAHAIDREAIVRWVLGGHARLANGLLPPEHWSHAPVPEIGYDPAAARRLLAEAGTAVRVSLKTSTVELRRRIGEAIGAMLGDVGIVADVRPLEWASLYGDVRRGAFDLFALAWFGIRDPDHYHAMLHSEMAPPRGSNRGGFADAEVDALTVAARGPIPRAERRALYDRVAGIVQRDVPYVPLWWVDNVVVKNRRLAGFVPSPGGDLRSLAHASWTAQGRGGRS
ncbi:MAG: ABC transporter substrate-binding protein [Deltaproteobacteria bacterium]|nr:ABC transporter substrate-binding protein [Deltaproteobacteria bacterium]